MPTDSSCAATSTVPARTRPSTRSCSRCSIITACVSTYPPPRITPPPPTTCSISSSDPPTPMASRPSKFCLRMMFRIMTLSRGRLPSNRCRHVTSTVTYSFRNIKSIDKAKFQDDIIISSLFNDPAETADEFAVQIDSVVTGILDAHCPLQTRTKLSSSSSHRDNRWLSPEAISAKRERRRLERLWKSRGLEHDRAEYRKACRTANKAIIASRCRHYTEKIQAAGSNTRERWSAIRNLLHSSGSTDANLGGRHQCDLFMNYFVNKIRSVKAAIAAKLAGVNINALRSDGTFSGEPLRDHEQPTVDEVRKLIDSMPAKSSPIDSIPTSIIKSCSEIFSILITRLATLSFRDGSFPGCYKTASVTPLLKKKDLDRDNPANFRPISNLHTISKVLERLFLSRINAHVEGSTHYNQFQSAYRRGFSTETAILRMLNDVYCAADKKC